VNHSSCFLIDNTLITFALLYAAALVLLPLRDCFDQFCFGFEALGFDAHIFALLF